MKQFFEVGELIVLQSPNLPEYNGEYTIHAVIQPNEDFVCRLTGNSVWTDEGLSYILDQPLLDFISSDGTETFWAPSSIKKKHDKGDMSFKSLMNSLKSPVLEWK